MGRRRAKPDTEPSAPQGETAGKIVHETLGLYRVIHSQLLGIAAQPGCSRCGTASDFSRLVE